MKYSGPLGVRRPLGVGPLVSQEQEQALSREEFIRRCQESQSSEDFVRGFARAFGGEETADQLPTEQVRESSKDFCEGIADFLGF